jgi:hypothetical protein
MERMVVSRSDGQTIKGVDSQFVDGKRRNLANKLPGENKKMDEDDAVFG